MINHWKSSKPESRKRLNFLSLIINNILLCSTSRYTRITFFDCNSLLLRNGRDTEIREKRRKTKRGKREREKKETCQKGFLKGLCRWIGQYKRLTWKERLHYLSEMVHKNVPSQLIRPHWQVPAAFTRRCTRLRVASSWIQMHLQVDVVDLRV